MYITNSALTRRLELCLGTICPKDAKETEMSSTELSFCRRRAYNDLAIVKNGPLALACTFAKIVEVDFVGFWTMNNLGTTQVPTTYRGFNSELHGWQHRSRTISFSCQVRTITKTE
jgi:hypothetical protein